MKPEYSVLCPTNSQDIPQPYGKLGQAEAQDVMAAFCAAVHRDIHSAVAIALCSLIVAAPAQVTAQS